MSINWVIFCVSLWVVGSVLGATINYGDPFGSNVDKVGGFTSPKDNVSNFPGFITKLWEVFTLDYDFFHHPEQMQILRWICLIPIVAGITYAIIVFLLSIFRGGAG